MTAKKRSESSAVGRHRIASTEHILNSTIDFSDIPDSTPEELKRAVRVGRPKSGQAKQMIAFRISPGLLDRIRKLAAKKEMPYQSLLHDLLEDAVKRSPA